MILNRHHHLPEVETHRSVPLPFRSDQPFGRYSRKKAKNEDCANRHVSNANDRFLIRHHHLPEVETHRSVTLPVAIGPAVRTLFAKGLKIRIVPIAIGMCQVPPIACQQAQSYSRCRSTSIIVSPNPIGPVVRTVFAKRLKIRIVPIAISMCQVSPIDSQEAPSSSRGGNTSIYACPIPIGPDVRTLFV